MSTLKLSVNRWLDCAPKQETKSLWYATKRYGLRLLPWRSSTWTLKTFDFSCPKQIYAVRLSSQLLIISSKLVGMPNLYSMTKRPVWQTRSYPFSQSTYMAKVGALVARLFLTSWNMESTLVKRKHLVLNPDYSRGTN